MSVKTVCSPVQGVHLPNSNNNNSSNDDEDNDKEMATTNIHILQCHVIFSWTTCNVIIK